MGPKAKRQRREALPSDKTSTPDALRIAMVGKTGCGKSSTGNTILGRKGFVAKAAGKSVTVDCSKADSDVDGRRVAVVDTPGLFDTSLSNEQTMKEAAKSINYLAPGPHAILIMIQIGRFTEEEKGAVNYIKKAFGEGAEKYIMILFSRGDDLENDNMSIEEYIEQSEESLKKLIADCGNKYHVFNNRKEDRTQVKELLKKIDHMVQENGGSYYTNEMLQYAEAAIEEEKERILKEKEEEMRREEEKIERKYKQIMEKTMQEEKQKQEEEKRQMDKKLQEMDEKIKEGKKMQKRAEREREKEMERTRESERQRQIEREQREREERERDRERERQRQIESEQREREHRARLEEIKKEMEEKTAAEKKKLTREYEWQARKQAEQSNSFLDNVVEGLEAVGEAVVDGFKSFGSWVGSWFS